MCRLIFFLFASRRFCCISFLFLLMCLHIFQMFVPRIFDFWFLFFISILVSSLMHLHLSILHMFVPLFASICFTHLLAQFRGEGIHEASAFSSSCCSSSIDFLPALRLEELSFFGGDYVPFLVAPAVCLLSLLLLCFLCFFCCFALFAPSSFAPASSFVIPVETCPAQPS